MGAANTIPGVEEFSKKCPVVSQARSAVESACGDNEAARNTQVEFYDKHSNSINNLNANPCVGHIKRAILYAAGDKIGGDEAMKESSRALAVQTGRTVGFLVGGPVGAVVGGAAGGLAADGIITAAQGEKYGTMQPLLTICQGNINDEDIVDLSKMVVSDAVDGILPNIKMWEL